MGITHEARAAIKAAFPSGPSGLTIEQHHYDKSCITVVVDLDYHGEVSFEQLCGISEALGTKRINLDDYETNPGCDTCGAYSSRSVTIFARDCTKGLTGC